MKQDVDIWNQIFGLLESQSNDNMINALVLVDVTGCFDDKILG